jgi:hypothetical protein
MTSSGKNEGIRVLDDFVCEAVSGSDAPKAAQRHQGRNEGMQVVEEIVFQMSNRDAESEKGRHGQA